MFLTKFLATIIPMEKTQHLLKYNKKDVQQRIEQHKKTFQDKRLASLNFSGTYQENLPASQLSGRAEFSQSNDNDLLNQHGLYFGTQLKITNYVVVKLNIASLKYEKLALLQYIIIICLHCRFSWVYLWCCPVVLSRTI